jgi:hypothetical protein
MSLRELTMPKIIKLAMSLLFAVQVWAQNDNPPSRQPVPAMVGVDNSSAHADSYIANSSNDRMLTPPPVSGQAFPTSFVSEERSNYLQGGLSFTGAYGDNELGVLENGLPVSGASYSVSPLIALNETIPRLHYMVTYAPGFTFYQHASSRNQADQNAAIEFEYRLSPHLTFSAHDAFQKSSNVFDQPSDLAPPGTVSGGTQGTNFSVIAPVADRLSNSGDVGITYQFALNGMVGASGTFSNIHYPNPAQVPGLYDSTSQAASAFYSFRILKKHYFGAAYQYQRFVAYPTIGLGETQTQALLFFYTMYPTSKLSFSIFGGPQHSDTVEPPLPSSQPQLANVRAWSPEAGASLSWQGLTNSFAISYSHVIASGGGMIGAIQLDNTNATVRQQITRTLTGSVSGWYVSNSFLGSQLFAINSGHAFSATASLQQQLGQFLNAEIGYTRIHQNYRSVPVLSSNPDMNRFFVSLNYRFSRSLGR